MSIKTKNKWKIAFIILLIILIIYLCYNFIVGVSYGGYEVGYIDGQDSIAHYQFDNEEIILTNQLNESVRTSWIDLCTDLYT